MGQLLLFICDTIVKQNNNLFVFFFRKRIFFIHYIYKYIAIYRTRRPGREWVTDGKAEAGTCYLEFPIMA